jgi:hypothetical protein
MGASIEAGVGERGASALAGTAAAMTAAITVIGRTGLNDL